MKKYINVKTTQGVETVDEFEVNTKDQRVEFKKMLVEYRISDTSNYYYSSSRCTNEWKKR